jgi:hypothetical protein
MADHKPRTLIGYDHLGKNKLLSKEDIDLKHLLTESYEKGDEELLFVVQFVSKVLESYSGERFGLKNTWKISVMNSTRTGCETTSAN